ncbi:MAG: hypothetical protein P4L73_14360 [Caulobacteraceae bacterium]|nr:hypothetical protein [Caulobacteraceae bacterium]
MAKDSGGRGGGAFAWTLLGFLAGVAATLGIQTLVGGAAERPSQADEAVSGQVHITTTAAASSAPRAKLVKKPVLAETSSAPAAPVAAIEPNPEVADDAAAAGMTSRIAPGGAQTDSVPAAN